MRKAQGVATGRVKMQDLRVPMECRFEFTTREGTVIRATNRVTFDSGRLGDEPHEPVLYDPADPKQAALLDGLPVPVRVGLAGDLEATGTIGRVLALLGVGGLVIAAAAGGWIAAGMLK